MTCLVLGNHTQGLSVVRAIGSRGIPVHVMYDKHICLSRFSNFTHAFHKIAKNTLGLIFDPANQETVLRELLALAPRDGKMVLFGVSEDMINFFYQHADSLRERYLFPENDIDSITDKYKFAAGSDAAGVPSPKTYLLSELDPAVLAGKAFVAKGRTGNKFRRISNLKGLFARDTRELGTLKEYIAGKVGEDEVIVQEMVESSANITSCCGFAVAGELLTPFMYEKIRQFPKEFGTGSYTQSIYDEELLDSAVRLIRQLRYTGIFEIEFLKESATGKLFAIEMNPRTWKGVGLAQACGQDLCGQYYDFLTSGRIPGANFTYTVGRKWAHLLVDAAHMIRSGNLRLNYDRDMVFCDFSLQDPKPFLAQIVLLPLIAAGV